MMRQGNIVDSPTMLKGAAGKKTKTKSQREPQPVRVL
jgi:hypothetical protein